MQRIPKLNITKKQVTRIVIVLVISLLTSEGPVAFSAGNNDKLSDVLSAQQERIRVIEAAAKTSVSVFAGSCGGSYGMHISPDG